MKYVGEIVVMMRASRPDQNSRLQAKYRERPLQVMEVLPGDTYRVVELATDSHEVYVTTTHVSQLKSWKILREVEEDPPDNVRQEDEETRSPIAVAGIVRPIRSSRRPAHFDDYHLGEV